MVESDINLLQAIEKKDSKAFESFYNRYARLLQTWALKHTHNKDLSEDIAQNFWIVVWTSPERIKTNKEGSAKDYLLRYFTYRMLDYIKSAGARAIGEELKLAEMSQELCYTHIIEEIEIKEIQQFIVTALNHLPELTRKVFDLRWNKNYSTKEAAQKLNVSEKIVRTNYHKTMPTLRNQLGKLQSDGKKHLSPETALIIALILELTK